VNAEEDDSLSDMTIRMLDLNTHVVTRLVTEDFESTQPVWSPDGLQLPIWPRRKVGF
jgi:Tol biopolymer transport system component